MSFQYPLGLLGLIGVPILIIVYIIKSKFTEQTVSATYLWNLSNKFLKKKKKDNRITGIISLVLQILAVVLISFAIAHPVFTVENGANEYCFIIDGTGSMNMMSEDGKTRFELAKDEVRDIIDDSMKGSLYTIIAVSGDTNVICERESDKEAALTLLDRLETGYGSVNFDSALRKAQSYFDENSGTLTYVFTDKKYQSTNNITLVNVSDGNNNFSVYDVEHEHSFSGELTVRGKVVSYEADAEVEIRLLVDGASKDGYTLRKSVKKATPADFEIKVSGIKSFKNASVAVTNSDNMMLDNEVVIYNVESENAYKTLLVSDTPFFLESVLGVVGSADITVMTTEDYLVLEEKGAREISGYNLYIFHSCNPKSVPKDGSVWLINTSASIENSGFGYQGERVLDTAMTIDKTTNTLSIIRDKLLKDVKGKDIYISKYSKYDTSSRKFYTLFTYAGDPVIFTGTNAYGNREVVFAFDLHNSDMPLKADFAILVKNLLDFSFPAVIEDSLYNCGENAQVNVVSGCESIRVESPSGVISHISLDEAVGEIKLDEVGTYSVKVVSGDTVKTYHIYSAFSLNEQDPSVKLKGQIGLDGVASSEGFEGTYDSLIAFFICLAVIFVADWVVYCYDKYQLR